jgi:dipeptidyl aminopeptidase/acylaminoacyl peptidase
MTSDDADHRPERAQGKSAMRQQTRLLVACGLLLCLAFPAAAQKRPLVPADYYRQVNVGEVAVAPSGELVAFTVTTVVEKENSRHREIWIQRLKDGRPEGAPTRFTGPTEDATGATWSPDSTTLSFTSRRGKDPNSTWFARVVAPGGEAYHIEGVSGRPVWSPDGKWIAFTKAPEPDVAGETEKNPREGWVAKDAVSHTLDPKRFDGRVITSLRYKRDGTLQFMPDPAIRQKTQLFIVPASGGEARQVTRAAFDVGSPKWTSDSRTVIFTGDEEADDELKAEPTVDLYAISAEGGEPRKLTRNPGSETAPAISPKGDKLAFLQTLTRGAETDLMVVDLGSDGSFRGQPRNLTAAWDNQPGSPSWTADGTAVRFAAGIGGDTHLFEVPLQGRVSEVTTGARHTGGFSASADGSVMAYVVDEVTRPAELHIARGDGSQEQKATSFNDALLAEVDLVTPERLTWKVKDGTTIEGWLMKPVGYTPGRKYPMVLKIHGGPHGAYGTGWFDTFQVLSGAGFFVLYSNPRGSTGYGHAFTYATRGKWGEMDQEDFITGVDTALAKYPDIDPSRVGVSGGSYGGFMSNWLTARTDRFAASVTSRSITNWESWYGSSDAQGLTDYEFMGAPWEQRELYRRLSPISYVESVTAPTLIIMGEEDYRTPISDNEQWFVALKKRKVPVELARYPRSAHGLSRDGEPWLLVDRQERIRSWFVHWLIENPARVTDSRAQ